MAQRGGGGHGGGGFGGGGFHGGGGMGGGFGGGGFRGGGGFGGGGFRGGFGNGGFRGGFGYNRFGYGLGYGGYGYGYPGWGWGIGWGYPYYGVGYGYDTCWDYNSCNPYGYGYDPGYGYGGYAAPAYSTSPGVTVISVPQSTTPAYTQRASPVTHEYDQYGQEVHPSAGSSASASPVYLIAFTDHNIRAAQAYWVDGQVLHYVTLEHQERQVALSEVDRKLSLQLNSERHVSFQLP